MKRAKGKATPAYLSGQDVWVRMTIKEIVPNHDINQDPYTSLIVRNGTTAFPFEGQVNARDVRPVTIPKPRKKRRHIPDDLWRTIL